jgi:superfamily II DNA or RNA helicase
MSDPFGTIGFRGQLRPSQQDAARIAERQLTEGETRLHIVAPPGSGKTVLGLYLWADHIRRPVVVLSPNSAIQAQWAARTSLFGVESTDDPRVSTDPKSPALLTSLTYQSITLPQRGGADLNRAALSLWEDRLIEKGEAEDADEAEAWIKDLCRHNSDYYDERLSAYRKEVRDSKARGGDAMATLHESALATLDRLKRADIGLIILDECHHLMGHWGRVLADAQDFLADPIIIGLTATPPDRDGRAVEDVKRYDKFFGPIDYDVPVPAVVKDGFLSPYQDLAYFVRPTAEELAFVANADEQLHALVEQLCESIKTDAPAYDDFSELESPVDNDGEQRKDEPPKRETDSPAYDDFDELIPIAPPPGQLTEPEPVTAAAAPDSSTAYPTQSLIDWVVQMLTEFRLPTGKIRDWEAFQRRDPSFALAGRLFLLRRELPLPNDVPPPLLELRIEEIPEMEILVPVLDRYVRHRLRRSKNPRDHQVADRTIARLRSLGVQITETGSQGCASPAGRVLAYSQAKARALLPIFEQEMEVLGDKIRAVVVTDYERTSAVTAEVDHLLDDEAGGAIAAFKMLLSDPRTDALDPVLVTGSSVLVDDDLAERFRVESETWLAENGHDVSLAYQPENGFFILNGSGRDWCPRVYVAMVTELFQRGVTRCLVGTRGLLGEGWDANKVNVLVDLTTVTTSMTVQQIRGRSLRIDKDDREKLADNWDVVCLAPEFSKGLDDYRRFVRKHKNFYGVTDDGAIEKGVGHVHAAFTDMKPEGLEGAVGMLNSEMLKRTTRRQQIRELWKIGEPYRGRPIRALELKPTGEGTGGFPPFSGRRDPWTAGTLTAAIAEAVLGALTATKQIPFIDRRQLHVGERAGGYVRVFLESASEKDAQLFTRSMHEALGPLDRPRYVIPRHVDHVRDTWLSKILPSVIGKYFQLRRRSHVMLHAVPSALAKNKDLVAEYQRFWNFHVSPGEAVYAHRGDGETLVERAKEANPPTGQLHEKDVFL